MISDNLERTHGWLGQRTTGWPGHHRRLRLLPAGDQGSEAAAAIARRHDGVAALPPERRAPDDRADRGPARARLPAPAAPVTGVGACRADGLHRWADLDRGGIRWPALVVLLPDLGWPLRGPLFATGPTALRQPQGLRPGLRRDPDG